MIDYCAMYFAHSGFFEMGLSLNWQSIHCFVSDVLYLLN